MLTSVYVARKDPMYDVRVVLVGYCRDRESAVLSDHSVRLPSRKKEVQAVGSSSSASEEVISDGTGVHATYSQML